MSTAVVKRELADVAASDPQLNALQRIASQVTPQKHIRFRKGRGGMVFKYVDGAYVVRTLNEAFGHNWDFEADNEQVIEFNGQPFEIRCRGRLTVRLAGQAVTKVQYGSQAIEFIKDKQGNIIAPVTIGDCFKGAATDALKKCASMLGVALDLYDSDFKPSDLAEYHNEVYKTLRANEPIIDPDPIEAEPEPVKTIKLEGAQPQADWCGDLPEGLEGPAGHVVELAKKLKWHEGKLAQCVEANFGIIVAPGQMRGYLEGATKDELRELYRSMNSKGGKR